MRIEAETGQTVWELELKVNTHTHTLTRTEGSTPNRFNGLTGRVKLPKLIPPNMAAFNPIEQISVLL